MADLSSLTTSLRRLANDSSNAPYSNVMTRETPDGVNDGNNTHFRLSKSNLIPGSIYWSADTTYRSQTGVTIDDAAGGLITINPAPPAGTQASPFQVDYAYKWFLDADYIEMLNDGARDLTGYGDPTRVQDGLVSSLLMYALGYFWLRRATQYAHLYSSTGGQAGETVDTVTKNFKDLATLAFERANKLRADFYKGLGEREHPSSSVVTYSIDPMSPLR